MTRTVYSLNTVIANPKITLKIKAADINGISLHTQAQKCDLGSKLILLHIIK